MMQLKVKRLDPSAVLPSYARAGDAGLDLFAVRAVTITPLDTNADLDAQRLSVSAQRLGAADGLRRAVERDQVAIAGVLDHRAAESLGEFGSDLTEALQHRPPPLVARSRGTFGRGDDVGEQHSAQGAM